MPHLAHVAFFLNPANDFHTVSMRQALAAAQALNIKLQPCEVRKSEDLDAAFAAIVKEKPDGLLILADRIFLHNRQRMMDFATEHRLPSVNAYRELVEAGGLTLMGRATKRCTGAPPIMIAPAISSPDDRISRGVLIRPRNGVHLCQSFIRYVQHHAAGLSVHGVAVMSLQTASKTGKTHLVGRNECAGKVKEQ